MERTLIFHSDLFHEVSLDYHTTIISQQMKLFVKKMTKNQESSTSQRCNKIHLFDKNPVFFICSGVNMPINLMNFLTPVNRGKNLVSRNSCKSRPNKDNITKEKEKNTTKCWQRKHNFPRSWGQDFSTIDQPNNGWPLLPSDMNKNGQISS